VRVNVMTVAMILESQRIGRIRRAVFTSSSTTTYWAFDSLEPPIPEDFPLRLISHRPRSMYAVTKLMDELLALAYHDNSGVTPVVLRYAAVIGAWRHGPLGIPARMIRLLLDAGAGRGKAVFDDPLLTWKGGEEFVDVRDVAAANLAALAAPDPKQIIYNIASGELVTMDAMIAAAKTLYPGLDAELRVVPTGAMAGAAHPRPGPSDISAAKRDLGYMPRYKLLDSLMYVAERLDPNRQDGEIKNPA
jgi:UDP-glucose 4-epimerase